jgi:hypothetical protein
MLDAGNYATDISHALAHHHVQVLVRLRATRLFYADPQPRKSGEMGAGKRHGREFSCSDPSKTDRQMDHFRRRVVGRSSQRIWDDRGSPC